MSNIKSSKCVIILSEKSSGSSVLQSLLCKFDGVSKIDSTRHNYSETLYWTKAASLIGRNQLDMVNSEVPICEGRAKKELNELINENIDKSFRVENNIQSIIKGWSEICLRYSPVYVEKSPHHLVQWPALELILKCIEELHSIDFLLVGLIRNPIDTIYSQHKRFGSSPRDVEIQWITAYYNLLLLKEMAGDKVLVIKYEDIVDSLKHMSKLFKFCGVDNYIKFEDYLHSDSIGKWRNDLLFNYNLSGSSKYLAKRFGYSNESLNVDHSSIPMCMSNIYIKSFSALKRAWYGLG